jgi:hypothetical protein
MLLRCLTGVAISTGVLGMFATMRLAWIFTGLSGVALLGVVALMGYAREVETQQRRARRYLPSDPEYLEAEDYPVDGSGMGAAEAGYPGAWDEEYELPRQAVGGAG